MTLRELIDRLQGLAKEGWSGTEVLARDSEGIFKELNGQSVQIDECERLQTVIKITH